jgi:hypothetical protein
VQFVPLPESFMNQTDHKVKETANTQFTWTRALAHSIYTTLTFGIWTIGLQNL